MRDVVVILFFFSYLGITARRLRWLPVGRPAAALIGAVALIIAGEIGGPPLLGFDTALNAIELRTLVLLLGMMLVAGALQVGGFFQWAVTSLQSQRLSPPALLWAVTVGCGVMAALVVNDAVCLLATPLVVALVRAMHLPLKPFLLAVAMGSNAGSALTLAGNPQNMLVASLSGLSYRGYLIKAGPSALLALLLTAALLHFFFRRELQAPRASTISPDAAILDRPLLWVTGASVTGAVVANLLGVNLALSAIAAGAVVLLASRERAANVVGLVDWSVLLFFAALFVLVGALQATGAPAAWVARLSSTAGQGPWALTAILSLGSQVVSNVPLILVLEPWLRSFSDSAQAWTLTALVSTLAGNLTVLGSVANIIVLEQAQARIGFWEYARIGIPVTVASTVAAVGLCLLWW